MTEQQKREGNWTVADLMSAWDEARLYRVAEDDQEAKARKTSADST